MSARHPILLPVAAVVSAALLTACGSTSASPQSTSSGSASESPTAAPDAVKDAFAASFLAAMTKDNLAIGFDKASARCVADKFVDTIGQGKLVEYGLSGGGGDLGAHPFSHEDATVLSNAVVTCAPDDGAIKYLESQFDEGLGAQATAEQKACMKNAIGRQQWIDLLTSEYDGHASEVTAAFQAKATAAAKTCLQ
jgi:hypothetical protein